LTNGLGSGRRWPFKDPRRCRAGRPALFDLLFDRRGR
jgi:hypothetical protein